MQFIWNAHSHSKRGRRKPIGLQDAALALLASFHAVAVLVDNFVYTTIYFGMPARSWEEMKGEGFSKWNHPRAKELFCASNVVRITV